MKKFSLFAKSLAKMKFCLWLKWCDWIWVLLLVISPPLSLFPFYCARLVRMSGCLYALLMVGENCVWVYTIFYNTTSSLWHNFLCVIFADISFMYTSNIRQFCGNRLLLSLPPTPSVSAAPPPRFRPLQSISYNTSKDQSFYISIYLYTHTHVYKNIKIEAR